eukprot:XP_016659929.1 PREDICTED: uncharacterized protein LOC100569594 [Acyrthosiphon pisum]
MDLGMSHDSLLKDLNIETILKVELYHKSVKFYSDKVAKILGNKTLRYSEWWSDMLEWIFSPNDFLAKVQTELEDNRVPGVPNIAKRLKSVNDIHKILGVWLADLNTARISIISKLKALEDASMNDLVQSALMCHLSFGIRKRRCFLCDAETELQVYGSLLFSVPNKRKNTLNDMTKENDKKTMYDSTGKCLMMISQKELILIKLFQYGQAKIKNKSCLEDAAEHIKVLDLVREEFHYLKFLLTFTRERVHAYDKMNKAKSQRSYEFYFLPAANEDDPPEKRDYQNNLILQFAVRKFEEIPTTTAYLKQKVGTLLYLENLKKEKENSTEVDTCPICCLNGDTGWDKALNLLGEALDQNSISYRILKTGTKYKKTLKDFKVCKKLR